MEALNKQAVRVMHLFGESDVTNVSCSVGAEQEYFLIDKEKYLRREAECDPGRVLF